ncbi:MAG: hypothetical protein GXY76_00885, partial [Chloroflexi bacterium]|nr:hypothetical protein [Chloroflexota bacterium]
MKELRQCLIEYPPVMLEAIAQGWGLTVRGAEIESEEAQAAVVEALASRILTPEAVAEVLARLSPPEMAALADVAKRGLVPARAWLRDHGKIDRPGPAKLERTRPWLAPESPAERLWYLGLVYRGYGLVSQDRGEVYFIPPDLLSLLPFAPAPPEPVRLEPGPAPARPLEGPDLPADILALLSYVRSHELRLAQGAYLARRDVAALRERLSRSDEGYVAWAQRLTLRLGLLRREGQRLRPSPAARDWLQAPPAQRLRALLEAWREDRGWNELRQLPGLRLDQAGPRLDPRLPRQRALDELRRLQPGAWYALESWVRAMQQGQPDFLRPDGDYDAWYIRDAASGHYLSGYEHWDRIEGALLRHYVGGPLHWLGITRLGGEAAKP